jgi:A/G-specific adenine glycosylase
MGALLPSTLLKRWYAKNGRHNLVWRQTDDLWVTLVSEVMLQQTPVSRIEKVFDTFLARFPTPEAMATSTLADVIRAWDRLGYPRRARNLYATSRIISQQGWPDPEHYETLPGVGTYTANALRALCSGSPQTTSEHFARDVNINRVCTRMIGSLKPSPTELLDQYLLLTKGLPSRDGLLAVMDLGSLVCTKVSPRCETCPVRTHCSTQGTLEGEARSRQKPYEGSFRQKRGDVLAQLREGSVSRAELDETVVESLKTERFVRVTKTRVFLAES